MILTKEVTAKSLLTEHWMKLGAELPDVYEFLVALAVADGTPFTWPGMRYLTEEEAKCLGSSQSTD
jgi:hypothetical protein